MSQHRDNLRITDTEARQIATLDDLCALLGLARGVFTRGGKHGRYTVSLPNGRKIFMTIAGTPRCVEAQITHVRKNMRHNIARAMGWTS